MDFPLGVNSDFLAPVMGSVSSVRIRKALMAHPRLCHFVWGGSFLGVGFFWGHFWCRADFWVFSAPILFEVARDWETVHEIYCNTHILSWAVFEINLLFLPPQGRLKVFRQKRLKSASLCLLRWRAARRWKNEVPADMYLKHHLAAEEVGNAIVSPPTI